LDASVSIRGIRDFGGSADDAFKGPDRVDITVPMATQESPQAPRPVVHIEPQVRLVAHTQHPFQLAVASARTCYASDFVFMGRLDKKGERTRTTLLDALPQFRAQLDEIGLLDTPHERRIHLVDEVSRRVTDADTRAALATFADLARQRAASNAGLAHDIYEAGHHTPFQHPTFVFALEGVSRNVVESFLHNHTFYNSEQQSQRYVEMKRAEVHVPASVRADPEALRLYEEAVRGAWDAYHDLRERLVAHNRKVMAAIGRVKGQTEKEVAKEAEKKSQEMARYVLPIAAATQLYHTVSGIVLLRYVRMCEAQDASAEARRVVDQMVEEVRRVDPEFVAQMHTDTRPRAEHAEWHLSQEAGPPLPAPFPKGRHALLVHATPDAERLVAAVVREVTGSTMADGELLAAVMDPARNAAWGDTLNTWDHSPVLRALRHVHVTFRKRMSLTAYAQDQRHRMTPGTRPLLARLLGPAPDVHVPESIAADAESLRRYEAAIAGTWAAMLRLRDRHGVPAEECAYLLPNAAHLQFHQTGDLLSLLHKWRLRTCFNAQREIFEASMEELRQAQAAYPRLLAYAGPPCSYVAARQPAALRDSVEACCPEASWCGVKVWRSFDAAKGTPKRPY
jgi:flavin-dependent thymidylate synthase